MQEVPWKRKTWESHPVALRHYADGDLCSGEGRNVAPVPGSDRLPPPLGWPGCPY